MTLQRRILLSLALLFVPLLVGEAALRVRGYDPLASIRSGDWRRTFLRPSNHPGLGYELVPGSRGIGWNTPLEINSLGFRDRELAREKPAGTVRIASIGDSLTFGNGVALEATFAKELERRLNGSGLHGGPIEVLNLGVAGYDAAEAVHFLEARGLGLDPDLVVLGYCINDAGAATINRAYIEAIRRYSGWIYRSRLVQWIGLRQDLARLRDDFWLVNEEQNFAREFQGSIRDIAGDTELAALMGALAPILPEGQPHEPQHAFLRWYVSPAHVGRVRFAFERLAALTREHGFRALVAVLPYLAEGGEQAAYDLAYAIVRHEALRAGLGVLELQDPVRAAGAPGLRARANDPLHFNAEGHALLAAHLHEHLTASGLLAAALRRAAGD